jgi:hypothetical protein
MFTRLNPSTKKAAAIVSEWRYNRNRHESIHDAYGRPSYRKVSTYNDIERRANDTPGYNHDLTVTGANSSFYSTIYSFTDEEGTHIIKDTASNVYEVVTNEI